LLQESSGGWEIGGLAGAGGVPTCGNWGRRLGYERVCKVLAILSEVGFKRVGLVTEKEAG
jgi:hypothetical protein